MQANMLAVYTHSDAKRIEALLGQTKLVNDKWFEKRGKLTWIEFQIRDAIDFVHRREMARTGREDKAKEESSTKKEGSCTLARTTKTEKDVTGQKASVSKGKPGKNWRRSPSAKSDSAAPKPAAEKRPTRKPKRRTS